MAEQCNNCGMNHAPDDKAACIEGHGADLCDFCDTADATVTEVPCEEPGFSTFQCADCRAEFNPPAAPDA